MPSGVIATMKSKIFLASLMCVCGLVVFAQTPPVE